MVKSITFVILKKVMNPTISPLIDIQDVTLRIQGKLLLENIQLTIRSGEIVSIVGPNGAGKTTLVKLALGLILPTEGKVSRRTNLRIGYMPQRLHIDPNFPLTVERFLTLGNRTPKIKSETSIESVVKEVGIKSILESSLRSLSGGEFQRVLLARALLREPELLVLDEPAQGIDLMGQAELYDLILRIKQRYQCGVLLVSHDLNVVMAQTEVVVCLNQHICCQGHPEQVSQDPAFMALFGEVAQNLAIYTHRHDHHHDMKGQVMKSSKDDHE